MIFISEFTSASSALNLSPDLNYLFLCQALLYFLCYLKFIHFYTLGFHTLVFTL